MADESAAHRVAVAFHKALTRRDLDALMELYHDDAVLISTAVLFWEQDASGTLRGKAQLRPHFDTFFKLVGQDFPGWHHFKPCVDGQRLVVEYPSSGPSGEQNDIVESFDISNCKIAVHRMYWNFRSVQFLQQNA